MSDTNLKPAAPITSIYSLDESIAGYDKTISELESAGSNPSLEQIVAVLVARDGVENTRVAEPNPKGESITRLILLDNRLKAQAQVIATNESLSEWKENISIPPTQWWWNLKYPLPSLAKQAIESPDSKSPLQQAVERCDRALSRLDGTGRRRKRTPEHILEVLLARDEVAQHQCEEKLPSRETLLKIIELDKRLKKQQLTILRTKELPAWKSCLNPAPENWWWDLKLNLLGSEDKPMTVKDRLWIAGAIATTVIAAAILLNTGQVLKIFGGDKDGVQADTWQNALFGLQGTLVTAVGGAVTTGKGRRVLESLLINTPFVHPNWQARGLFGVSFIVLGGIAVTRYSLPKLGDLYLRQGDKFVEEAQFSQAREKYLQAKKLFIKDEDQVKVSLALGKVYEHKVDFLDAIEEYKSAKGTDNPEILNRLGRAIILQEMRKVGWKKPVTALEQLNDAENYIARAEKKIEHDKKQNPSTSEFNLQRSDTNENDSNQGIVVSWDEQNRVNNDRVLKEIKINQGILAWAQVDFNKAPDQKADKLLLQAQDNFKEAAKYEQNLPTTPDGREARCYAALAQKLTLISQGNPSSENTTTLQSYCKDMIDRGLNDPSDAVIMKAAWDLVDAGFPPKVPQFPSLKTPAPTQASNS